MHAPFGSLGVWGEGLQIGPRDGRQAGDQAVDAVLGAALLVDLRRRGNHDAFKNGEICMRAPKVIGVA
jgi:hypothetical protein